jgi:enoyl-CoA hydratase/carnithine racemase
MRFAVPGHRLQDIVYSGRTVVPADALQFGLIDETARAEELLDRACRHAASLAAIPAEVFAISKQRLRAPAIAALKPDDEVMKSWIAPETHSRIRSYLDRTLRKKQT